MATSLVALAMIPLLSFGALSVDAVRDRHELASCSEMVAAEVDRLLALVQLRFALNAERAAQLGIVQGRALGVSSAALRIVLGTDIEARAASAAADVDRLRVRLDSLPGAEAAFAPVMALRAGGVEVSAATAGAAYDRAESLVRAEALAAMESVRSSAHGLPGAGGLQRSVAALQSAFAASEAAVKESGELFDTFTTTGAEQDQSRLELARYAATRTQSLAELISLAGDTTALAEQAVALADPATFEAYERQVDAMLAPDGLQRFGAEDHLQRGLQLAPAIRDGYARADVYLTLVSTAADAVVTLARDLEAEATAASQRTLEVLGSVALLCVVGTALAARSIRRPLAQLEDRAREALEGTMAVAPLRQSGPREIRTVIDATNQLIENLAVVERQAAALAAGDLDDEALGRQVSGPLGHALHETFSRLADSLQAQATLQRRLSHDATHDALTGIPNRAAAMDAVPAALHRAQRSGGQVALLFIDLDGFKQVNDLYGHSVGDEVLRRTVQRMQQVGRGGDLLARLGGDEFLLVAEPIGDIAEAVAIAERLIAVAAEPIDTDGYTVAIGASVGVSLGSRPEDLESLVANADLAVYQAKAAGKGRVEVYDQALRRELKERTAIESDLRSAIAGDELELHYQPVLDTTRGRVVSVEALLRWDRPGHGPMSPALFIPIVESSNLIIDLDRWVLGRAFRQWREWQADPVLGGLSVAVNVSARHLLANSFAATVRGLLADTAMDPTKVIIELTETALLADLAGASTALNELRQLGVQVAVDDFGTGHTSFAYLRNLPVDTVKIDRSYISNLDDPTSTDARLAHAMTTMATMLGLRVVAEGIETATQLAALGPLGCHLAQGYLISRPLPAPAFASWIHAARPADART